MSKILRRWNYSTHQYEPYEVPDDWNVRFYSDDMDEIVNCPHCGRTLPFGETYTSHEIHGLGGMGYVVCPDCYEAERTRYMKAHRQRKEQKDA